MGKTKRSKAGKLGGDPVSRPGSLAEQILDNKSVRTKERFKTRQRQADNETYVDEKLSRKILEQARLQQEELERQHGTSSENERIPVTNLCPSKQDDTDEDGWDVDDGDNEDEDENAKSYQEHFEIAEEDEKALQLFMSHDAPARRTLGDIIREKLTEKKTEVASQMTESGQILPDIDERIIQVYKGVGQILRKYRSGKLPKAFKILPSLRLWEQILYITEPDKWTAAAMYQAVRIFTSNLNAKMAQRFFHLILYPRIRDDMAEFQRLNFHLYMSLKKSLFKPAAFFKGILLPLCECGNCTLREATIVSSILAKTSIPVLHSSAALLKIAEMDYNGANSIFLRVLLDKKYALPYRVIDAVVYHFIRFQLDKRQLPVLWHQSLLVFVQRYKEDLAEEQKEALLDLIKAQTHHTITPEIRREILHSKSRDSELPMLT